MKFTLKFHPEVAKDIKDSWEWYEMQRAGLGDEFILAIEATLEGIRRNPERFPQMELGTRKALLFRFPFVIVYQLRENFILILALFHTSRNPDIIQDRAE